MRIRSIIATCLLVLQAALNKCHDAGLQTDRICGPKTRKDALQWPYYRRSTGAFVDCFRSFK